MTHHLNASHNNGTVRVQTGDTILIQLDESPTTGYMWELVEAPSTGEPASSYEHTGSAMGGGGKRSFRLTVNRSGRVQLVNKRPWGGDVSQSFSVMVECGGKTH